MTVYLYNRPVVTWPPRVRRVRLDRDDHARGRGLYQGGRQLNNATIRHVGNIFSNRAIIAKRVN